MERYRTAATIEPMGELHLSELPFQSGEVVEVTVAKVKSAAPVERSSKYPLRGRGVRYESPFDSVAEEDWDHVQSSRSIVR